MTKVSYFTTFLTLLIGLNFTANAKEHTSKTPLDYAKECISQTDTDNEIEVKKCLVKCRIPTNASEAQLNQCLDAYNSYRNASGQSAIGSPTPEIKKFELDHLVATFTPKNGRLNRFKLVGNNSELAQRAAKVCAFKLPASQAFDGPLFQAQFRDEIRAFKNQGKNYAYKLSGISWSEDGRSMNYTCNIERVELVATE